MAMMTASHLILFAIIASTSFLPVASKSRRLADPSSSQRHTSRILRNNNNDNRPLCPAPYSECGYGLWNVQTCQCDCIPPFCHDANGDCYVPTGGACDKTPWEDCVNSENCPWYFYGVDRERCYTGSQIPAGVWNLFPTEQACCEKNNLYCNPSSTSTSTTRKQPTRRPTRPPIAAPKFEDLYEVIPVKFSIVGLPDIVVADDDGRGLKDEMMIILKRVLIDLADNNGNSGRFIGMMGSDSLKIKNVEEKKSSRGSRGIRRNRKMMTMTARRALARNLDVDYDVTVVSGSEPFRPIVLDWIEDSYDEIMQQIQDYINREYFADVNLKICTSTSEYRQVVRMCDGDHDVVVDVTNNLAIDVTPELPQVVAVDREVFPIKATFKVKQDNDMALFDELAQRLIEIYRDILVEVDGLNVTVIEVADIVTLPGGYVDVLFDVHSQKFGGSDVLSEGEEDEDVVTQTIQDRLDDILEQLQISDESEDGIADGQTGNDGIANALKWCINKEGVFTECETEIVLVDLPKTIYGLPLWAIFVVAGAVLLLCCLVCCWITSCIRRRNEKNNNANTTTYIHTGTPFTKKKSNPVVTGKKSSDKRPRRPPRPTRHERDRRRQPRRNSHESFQTRRSSHGSYEEQQLALYDTDRDRRPSLRRPRRDSHETFQTRRSSSESSFEEQPLALYDDTGEGQTPRRSQRVSFEDQKQKLALYDNDDVGGSALEPGGHRIDYLNGYLDGHRHLGGEMEGGGVVRQNNDER